MSLCFTLKTKSPLSLEVEGVTPSALRENSLAEIERIEILHGNARLPLAEFFAVRGDAGDERHTWEGDLAGVHWLGAKMTSGRIEVQGNIGRHLGSQLRGGEIHVAGDAGDWVGAEMHGGLIHVRGQAGNLVGSAYIGSPKGMTRGTILVGGNAGTEIGRFMRRGLIAIGGHAGDLVGHNMLAGSVLVFGTGGIRHGAGMKRGTLAFLGRERPPLLPTFRRACRYRPDFLPLVYRQLRKLGFTVPDELFESQYDLYSGDLLAGGRGEILLRAAAGQL